MTRDQEIHQAVLPAFIALAEQGFSAREMHSYLEQATKGMYCNASFQLFGPDLVEVLKAESRS